MSENLLVNPSFEALAVKPALNTALVLTPDPASPQASYVTQRGEINNAEGWTAWYVRDEERPPAHDPTNHDGWCEPEVRQAPHPGRQLDGLVGQLMFTFYRIHEGGNYQQVSGLTAGQKLVFRAAAHAWTGSGDDPLISLGNIKGAYSLQEGTPGAEKQATFYVGIDPTGGTNPLSPNVVWSVGHHIYNVYAAFVVEAVAQGDTVTVFTRQRFLYPFKHCDGYWDKAALTATAPEVEPTAYDRTYRMADPTYMNAAQVDEAYQLGRAALHTTGPSWDDAVPLAKYRPPYWKTNTVLAGPLPQADRARYIDWVAARDPATVLKFADSAEPVDKSVAVYKQGNPAWAGDLLLPSSYTLGNSGCLAMSLCSFMSAYDGVDSDPKAFNAWMSTHGGYTVDGLMLLDKPAEYWPGLVRTSYVKYNDPTQEADIPALKAALAKAPVIVRVDYKPETSALETHFCLAVVYREGDLLMMDPWTGTFRWMSESYWRGTLALSVRGFLVYSYTEPPVTPPAGNEPQYSIPSHNLIGLHMQNPKDRWPTYLTRAHPTVYKTVNQLGMIMEAKNAYPDVLTVYRRHTSNDGAWVDKPDLQAAAVEWLDVYSADFEAQARNSGTTVEDVLAHVDVIESINETIGQNWERNLRAIEFDARFADAVKARYHGLVYAGFGTAAIGNPPEDQVVALKPLAERSYHDGHYLGYHAYFTANRNRPSPSYLAQHWDYHAGRWMKWDEYFRGQGLYPRYYLGEGGIVFASDAAGLNFDSGKGWKSCGDFAYYIGLLAEFNTRVRAWNALHGNRCRGLTVFCYGGGEWVDFDWEPGDLDALSAWGAAL